MLSNCPRALYSPSVKQQHVDGPRGRSEHVSLPAQYQGQIPDCLRGPAHLQAAEFLSAPH